MTSLLKSHSVLSLSFGPIGDTLMLLTFFSELHEKDDSLRFVILAERAAPMISQLAGAYPFVDVWNIPQGFFKRSWVIARVFMHSWNVFIPGVAQLYSKHLLIFFTFLSMRPGNRTICLEGINSRGQKVPVHVLLPYDPSSTVIDNFRKAAPTLIPGVVLETNRPPHLQFNKRLPKDFPFEKHEYVVVHMFGMSHKRSLPPQRWRKLLTELTHLYPHFSFIVTGTSRDAERAHETADGIEHIYFYIDTPILEVAAIIENAALYIGVDTGITHLAGVLQEKSVIIGNRSNPTWLPTYNPNAIILTNPEHCTCKGDKTGDCYTYEDGQPYYRCMYEITDKEIFESIRTLLN